LGKVIVGWGRGVVMGKILREVLRERREGEFAMVFGGLGKRKRYIDMREKGLNESRLTDC
jgi:hypothetical protein